MGISQRLASAVTRHRLRRRHRHQTVHLITAGHKRIQSGRARLAGNAHMWCRAARRLRKPATSESRRGIRVCARPVPQSKSKHRVVHGNLKVPGPMQSRAAGAGRTPRRRSCCDPRTARTMPCCFRALHGRARAQPVRHSLALGRLCPRVRAVPPVQRPGNGMMYIATRAVAIRLARLLHESTVSSRRAPCRGLQGLPAELPPGVWVRAAQRGERSRASLSRAYRGEFYRLAMVALSTVRSWCSQRVTRTAAPSRHRLLLGCRLTRADLVRLMCSKAATESSAPPSRRRGMRLAKLGIERLGGIRGGLIAPATPLLLHRRSVVFFGPRVTFAVAGAAFLQPKRRGDHRARRSGRGNETTPCATAILVPGGLNRAGLHWGRHTVADIAVAGYLAIASSTGGIVVMAATCRARAHTSPALRYPPPRWRRHTAGLAATVAERCGDIASFSLMESMRSGRVVRSSLNMLDQMLPRTCTCARRAQAIPHISRRRIGAHARSGWLRNAIFIRSKKSYCARTDPRFADSRDRLNRGSSSTLTFEGPTRGRRSEPPLRGGSEVAEDLLGSKRLADRPSDRRGCTRPVAGVWPLSALNAPVVIPPPTARSGKSPCERANRGCLYLRGRSPDEVAQRLRAALL